MKLIYVFGKEGRMRFVSHLDLQRLLQRALNRTAALVFVALAVSLLLQH